MYIKVSEIFLASYFFPSVIMGLKLTKQNKNQNTSYVAISLYVILNNSSCFVID